MLDSLRFVQGAVAKKDFVPALTHFQIKGREILGYNGQMALCCPIDMDLEVTPKALPFIKAIQACKETISLHVTDSGRLSVKSGKFKAFIDCTPDLYPAVKPDGEIVSLTGGFLDAIKLLAPIIADDASRPWARGILFRGQSAYATNNVVIAEYWLGYDFPVEINIPKMAITELLRIGEEPERLQMTENSVTFHFSEGRWLRTQSYDLNWPDVSPILNTTTPSPVALPSEFFDALDDLTHFVGEANAVALQGNTIATSSTEGVGASVTVEGLDAVGVYNLDQLKLLKGVAEQACFTVSPARFFGERVRGAIAGMRITV